MSFTMVPITKAIFGGTSGSSSVTTMRFIRQRVASEAAALTLTFTHDAFMRLCVCVGRDSSLYRISLHPLPVGCLLLRDRHRLCRDPTALCELRQQWCKNQHREPIIVIYCLFYELFTSCFYLPKSKL